MTQGRQGGQTGHGQTQGQGRAQGQTQGAKSNSMRLKEAAKTLKKAVKRVQRVPSSASRRAKIDTGTGFAPTLYSSFAASTTTAALSKAGAAGAHTTGEQHFPRAIGVDTTEVEVEAEGRVKSLQLRVQGQLQSIRSLEGQLGDALQLLETRNKQLAHCNARLKAVTGGPNQGTGAGAGAGVGGLGQGVGGGGGGWGGGLGRGMAL
jgi:uncharacterized coiled-coil protein SlyX